MGKQNPETLEEAKVVINELYTQIATLQQMLAQEVSKLAADAIQHWARDAQEQKKKAESLQQQLDCSNSFYKVAIKERDFERIRVDNLERDLAAANRKIEQLHQDVAQAESQTEWGQAEIRRQQYYGEFS